MKQDIFNKVNNLLINSALPDEDVEKWQELMPAMDEQKLKQLYKLLNQKLDILTKADQTLIKIAEDVEVINERAKAVIPKKVSIVDMSIQSLVNIFTNDFVKFLNLEDDFVDQLEEYLFQSILVDEDVEKQISIFMEALMKNREILFFANQNPEVNKIKINQWLNNYIGFQSQSQEEGLDRITFVAQIEISSKLNETERSILLELLKVYDFLKTTTVASIKDSREAKIKSQKMIDKLLLSKQKKINSELNTGKVDSLRAGESSMSEMFNGQDNRQIEAATAILRLEKMIDKYPTDSLERLAIEEEIKQMKRK